MEVQPNLERIAAFARHLYSQNYESCVVDVFDELPKAFPAHWTSRIDPYDDTIHHLKSGPETRDRSLQAFFGIDDVKMEHLFFCNGQSDVRKYGGFELGEDSTFAEVICNIEAFIHKIAKEA